MQITDVLAQMGGIQSMARELGVSESQAATGAEALMPAILGGLKKQAQSQPAGLEGLGGMLGQLVNQGRVFIGLETEVTDIEVIHRRPRRVRRGPGAEGATPALAEAIRPIALQTAILDQFVIDADHVALAGIGPEDVKLFGLLAGGDGGRWGAERGGQGQAGVTGEAPVGGRRAPGVVRRDATGQRVQPGAQARRVDFVHHRLHPGEAVREAARQRFVMAVGALPFQEMNLGDPRLFGQRDPLVNVGLGDVGEEIRAAVLRRIQRPRAAE
jgi:hypothetical protein